MKRWLLITAICLAATVSAASQTSECPANMVCISPDAARKALEDSDARKALEAEKAITEKAIADYKAELATLRLELAKAIGEKTGSEQMVVRLSAIVDVLVKNTRKKSIGLIAF